MAERQPLMNGPTCVGYNLDAIYSAKKNVQDALLSDSPNNITDGYRCAIHMKSIKCPWTVKYQLLPVAKIINDNCKESACLQKVELCLRTIVDKYGKPLLLPRDRRHSDWMFIRFNNEDFKTKVDIIQGAREILYYLGYTINTKIGLAYPNNTEPQKERVAPLVGELMMAEHELLGYTVGTHLFPQIVEEILPPYMRKNQNLQVNATPSVTARDDALSIASSSLGERDSISHPHLTNGNTVLRAGPAAPSPPTDAPYLPTVLEDAKTLNSQDLEEMRRDVQSSLPTPKVPENIPLLVPGNIPLLDIFESQASLGSVGASPMEASGDNVYLTTELLRQQQQKEIAKKCYIYQQKLEEIGHLEKEIIRGNRAFYIDPEYQAKRLERRHFEKLLSQAQNELDLFDEQIREKIQVEERVEEKVQRNFSTPPSVYVPPKPVTAVQPQDTKNKDTKAQLMPSAVQPDIRCPFCNLMLRPEEKECLLCKNGHKLSNGLLSTSPSSPRSRNDSASSNSQTNSLSPKPKIQVWQCCFCSFLNPLKEKYICEMCARTTSDPVITHQDCPVPSSPAPEVSITPPEPKSMMVRMMEEEEEMIKMKAEAKRKDEAQNNMRALRPLRHQNTDPTSDKSLDSNTLPFSRSPPKRSTSEILPQYRRKSSLPDDCCGGFKSVPEEGYFREMDKQKRALEELADNGKALVSALRKSEMKKFAPCEFDFAYKNCGDVAHILPWLEQTWRPLVTQLQRRVSSIDPQLRVTEDEAKKALLDAKADLVEGTAIAIHYKLEKIHEVMKYGPFSIEQVQQELAETQGDVVETAKRLTRRNLDEFTRRIAEAVDQSPLTDPKFAKDVTDGAVDIDRRVRMILAEGQLQSWGRGEMVLRIMDHSRESSSGEEDWSNVTLEDIVEAVQSLGNYRTALTHLQQECQVCYIKISKNKLRSPVCCECHVCTDCLRQHFEIRVRERHIRDWVCPVCSEPDIEDEEKRDQHFQFMDHLLKDVVKQEVFDLFEQKLRDWTLMNDPNFRWCSHCDFGQFQADETTLKMICSKCHKPTCFECRKPWEDQHEDLTCEEFKEWKEANDPELQHQGLAKILAENGIDCPACKFRYALAKGGCMHFKCTQCQHEFCSGCLRPFKRENCGKHESCKRAGLHCHHPRDCLFYMRDYSVDLLQKLLKEHKIEYDTSCPAGDDQDSTGEGAGLSSTTCPVMEQKEVPDGLKDEPCGREVLKDHAGLCGVHYKEYLVGLINKNSIDPVEIMEDQQLISSLERNSVLIPPKRGKETVTAYRGKLIQLLQENVPLPKPVARMVLPRAAQAEGQTGNNLNKKGKIRGGNGPRGIRAIPAEHAEEAVQWI